MTDRHNFHERYESDEVAETTVSSHRSFGYVFAIVFALIGLWPLWNSGSVHKEALFVSGAFLAITLLVPRALMPLSAIWARFGFLLHRISNPVLLGLIFFGAVLPTGMIMRIIGKRPLHLKFDRRASSYWISRKSQEPDTRTMRNQF